MSASCALQSGISERRSVRLNTPVRKFYSVTSHTDDKIGVVDEIFRRILTPLYGCQESAIAKIAKGLDRKCFLLCENTAPVGVLVFKKRLSNEFSDYGITDSVEIKSLFLDAEVQNSGRGLGTLLLDKVKKEAQKLKSQGLHVTVSQSKPKSLSFFQKKGFKIVHQWDARYKFGVIEYLLFWNSQRDDYKGINVSDRASKKRKAGLIEQRTSPETTKNTRSFYALRSCVKDPSACKNLRSIK